MKTNNTLTPEQHAIIGMIEYCLKTVAANAAESSEQRSAVKALEVAHSEVLTWYERKNQGEDK